MTTETWAGWNPPEHWTLIRDTDDAVVVRRAGSGHTLRLDREALGPHDPPDLSQDGWRLSLVADGDELPTAFVASFRSWAGALYGLQRACEAVDELAVETAPAPELTALAADLTVRPSPA
jgi:hypothetical protein